jgi:hypothetical protein
VVAFRELIRFARFFITVSTKHTNNKAEIAGIFNMEQHMRLFFEK